MDEVYIKTDDLAKWVKTDYFENKDFITLDEFYRKFEDLCGDYDKLKEEFDNFKEYAHDVWEMREKGKYPFDVC